MTIDLSRRPWPLRDPAFRRRREALSRAACATERDEVLAQPLVAERTFTPGLAVDCPAGHVRVHAAEPHGYMGMTFMARSCECGNGWWERLP